MKALTTKNYITRLEKILHETSTKQIDELALTIFDAFTKGNKIIIAGNGGSASTASHWCCDLQKTTLSKNYSHKKRIKAICLNDNVPLVTAWGNDSSFEDIFSEQLITLADKNDLFIPITGSGNSPNIIKALKVCKDKNIKSFALLGFDGGNAKQLCDEYILVSENHYGIVEDMHLIIGHIVTELLKSKFE